MYDVLFTSLSDCSCTEIGMWVGALFGIPIGMILLFALRKLFDVLLRKGRKPNINTQRFRSEARHTNWKRGLGEQKRKVKWQPYPYWTPLGSSRKVYGVRRENTPDSPDERS